MSDMQIRTTRRRAADRTMAAGDTTLRDHIAMAVLPAVVIKLGCVPEMASAEAYHIADAMLRAREV